MKEALTLIALALLLLVAVFLFCVAFMMQGLEGVALGIGALVMGIELIHAINKRTWQ